MLDRLGRLLDLLERVMLAVAAVLLVATAVLMNTEVFARYLADRSTLLADEYSGYFLAACTMLCLVAALRRGRFLRVEGVVERLPRRVRIVLELIAGAIGAAVSGVLAFATFRLAATSHAYGSVSIEASQTPLAVPQAVLPVGFALLAIAFVETALRTARDLARTRP